MDREYKAQFECGCERILSTVGIAGPVSAICIKHQKRVKKLWGLWYIDLDAVDLPAYKLKLSRFKPSKVIPKLPKE
jgi:hypothetical protein